MNQVKQARARRAIENAQSAKYSRRVRYHEEPMIGRPVIGRPCHCAHGFIVWPEADTNHNCADYEAELRRRRGCPDWRL